MAKLIAYACLAVSGTLAAVYGYSAGNSELYGLLRAVGWGMVAVVGGCSPAWLFHHLDARFYGRAFATALAGAVCFCVTIYGSMGGITGSSDKVAAERARAVDAAKDDRSELARIAAERAKLPDFRPIGTVEADLAAARSGRPYKSSRLQPSGRWAVCGLVRLPSRSPSPTYSASRLTACASCKFRAWSSGTSRVR